MKQEAYEKAIELYQEKNDLNFEETPQEQMAAANNLLAIANCYRLSGVEEKAAAYFAEAEAKQKPDGLPMDEDLRKAQGALSAAENGATMPPKPKKGADIRKELEYYSALALPFATKRRARAELCQGAAENGCAAYQAGNQRDTETLLDRVLSWGEGRDIYDLLRQTL